MKGLLVRLSQTDSQAEAAFRTIAYFDALTTGQASLEALVRGAAALAECPAGMSMPWRPALRFEPRGGRLEGSAGTRTAEIDLGEGVMVWLERPGGRGPLDEIIVERMAVAAQVLLPADDQPAAATLADVALVETVLSGKEAPEERTRALRRLGIPPRAQLRIIVVATDRESIDPAAYAVDSLSRGRLARTVHVATVDRLAAVLVRVGDDPSDEGHLAAVLEQLSIDLAAPEKSLYLGVGQQVGAMDAHQSWTSALLALRFTSRRRTTDRVVEVGHLGSRVILASAPLSVWRADAVVQRLLDISAGPGGAVDVEVLSTFLSTGSLRQAAALLHMHHSSVASRIARLEERLGLSLSTGDEQFRAALALTGLTFIEADQRDR